MNIFYVYNTSKELEDAVNAIIIKQGFNFKAAIFGVLWAISNGVWVTATIMLFINILAFSLVDIGASRILISIFIFTLQGSYANTWQEWNLMHRKYKIIDIISANNIDEAYYKFFEKFNKNQA